MYILCMYTHIPRLMFSSMPFTFFTTSFTYSFFLSLSLSPALFSSLSFPLYSIYLALTISPPHNFFLPKHTNAHKINIYTCLYKLNKHIHNLPSETATKKLYLQTHFDFPLFFLIVLESLTKFDTHALSLSFYSSTGLFRSRHKCLIIRSSTTIWRARGRCVDIYMYCLK